MPRKYTPRRQSKRWLDGDCPDDVLAILDAGKTEYDRWTVIYRQPVAGTTYADTIFGYRGMSDNPTSPQGVGMYGELHASTVVGLRYRERPAKWSELPEAVKACVRRDCANP